MKSQLLFLAGGIVFGSVATTYLDSMLSTPESEFSPLPAPYYTTLFENDDVRIVEHRLDPGDSEPMHEHPPMFVYFIADAEVRVLNPDGSSVDESLNAGMTIELDRLSHALENRGSTSLHSILVEFRSK